MGAPTKYKKEFIGKATEYLDTYEQLGDKIPTIEGFADHIEVSKKTIYNWVSGKKPIASKEFLHALERIGTRQGKILQNKGLDSTFNSTIAKLMLSANHDMREKTDTTSDGESINTLNDEQINKIADRVIAEREGKSSV